MVVSIDESTFRTDQFRAKRWQPTRKSLGDFEDVLAAQQQHKQEEGNHFGHVHPQDYDEERESSDDESYNFLKHVVMPEAKFQPRPRVDMNVIMECEQEESVEPQLMVDTQVI